jgi:hypothetical protein
MAKAIIMKTTGIVNLNGKKASAGTFIQDGDTLTTGPSSFAGVMWLDDNRMVMKLMENVTWSNKAAGGYLLHGEDTLSSSEIRSQVNKQEKGTFIVQSPTGVAGTKG